MRKPTKILCIEDERELLRDIKEELEEADYEVITASNGHAALDLLLTEKPDLILCDVLMPKMDGLTFLKHIRSKRTNLDDVPFVFLTAKATRDDILKGKQLGVEDYLTKPVDYDLLLATIETKLGQIRRIRQQSLQKLRQIYSAMQQKKHTVAEDLHLTFVGDVKTIQPVTNGLSELGCVVEIITEDRLTERNFTLVNTDILFLVYSNVVHYHLNRVMERLPKNWRGCSVLLTPPALSEEQRNVIRSSGVSDLIEYPYPPVEVFKLLIKRLNVAA